jgi:hypothetical protein
VSVATHGDGREVRLWGGCMRRSPTSKRLQDSPNPCQGVCESKSNRQGRRGREPEEGSICVGGPGFRILVAKFRVPSGEAANLCEKEAKAQRDLDDSHGDAALIVREAAKSRRKGALPHGDGASPYRYGALPYGEIGDPLGERPKLWREVAQSHGEAATPRGEVDVNDRDRQLPHSSLGISLRRVSTSPQLFGGALPRAGTCPKPLSESLQPICRSP